MRWPIARGDFPDFERPVATTARRATIFMFAALLPWLTGCAGTAARSSAAPRQRLPNIVVLYADDLGYGDLGCYRPESKIPTPHLDRLAREGLRCTDAHSSSGICTPSRYALLTGRYHWRKFHRIVNVFGPSVFAPERLTLPEMLRQRGYRTACIGKWHLGWDWQAIRRPEVATVKRGRRTVYPPTAFDWQRPIPDGPLAHGFDHYFGDDVPNFPPYAWIEDNRVVTTPTEPSGQWPRPPEGSPECRPGPMAADWRLDAVMPELTRRAVTWLHGQANDERPFFLYFPFTSPHAPIVPTAEFTGVSKAGPYGDFVAQTDATVGAVLGALDELGIADDTLVIFTADNGPEHYAYERSRRFGHRSQGDLRGLKRDVFEGGHRVPLLVRWPEQVRAGATTDALISQTDLMATLAAIVDTPLPDDAAEDSFDLLPLLRGRVDSGRESMVHNTFAHTFAVRRGRWLLLAGKNGSHTRVPKWFAAAEEFEANPHDHALFDLRADPGQRRNLCERHPEIVAELRQLLQRLRDQGHSAPRLGGS
ncbi:MAG: arylsulfatase [bacterium]|nr:arylsulfatase [bacterium]